MRRPPDRRQRPAFPRLDDERGIALAVAVLALVVIGALVAGTFFAGRLEQRSGLNTLYGAQAFEAAEAGVATALAGWRPDLLNGRALVADTAVNAGSLAGGGAFATTVSRLSGTTFLIRGEGLRRDALGAVLSRRLVGLLVRLDPAAVDSGGALIAAGPVALDSGTVIDGRDRVPAGWDALCPPAAGSVPAVRSADGRITATGVPLPPVQVDSSIGPGTFTRFGAATFDALAASASLRTGAAAGPLGPSVAGGPCDAGDPRNWGEPGTGPAAVAACALRFPLVYAPASLRIDGGRGQGFLLVRGDLELTGGVEFYGVIVVLGRVTVTGAGARVTGGLLVAGAAADPSALHGAVIEHSSCAVRRALSGTALPRPLTEHSWSQLY